MKQRITTKPHFKIGNRDIGEDYPVYFIADIAANHDGDFERAKELIYLAKEAGADVAKFQHFSASTIVSDYEFQKQSNLSSHQSNWKKSVFEVYSDASINEDWTPKLKAICDKAEIEFMTSPYSYALADHADPYVNAFKIGSGDITWIDYIDYIAKKNKPVLLATGASDLSDVVRAVDALQNTNSNICIMQCNTNYTGDLENFKFVNLNVLQSYRLMFADQILGLSDHTPGHSAVLGAVALGARVIEKHFTDSSDRDGPDHKFSLTPRTWRAMVDATRELEYALGSTIKRIEDNEKSTAIVQRRSLCAARDLSAGTILTEADLIPLRPCPLNSFMPYELKNIIGTTLRVNLQYGQAVLKSHVAYALT